MPGISALLDTTGSINVAERLKKMVDTSCHHAWYQREQFLDQTACVGLGRTSLGLLPNDPQPAVDEKGSAVMFAGEWYETADGSSSSSKQTDFARETLRGYQREGKDFFRKLNGRFSTAIWDAQRKRLILVVDRLGFKPLYYAQIPGTLYAASELKSILTDPRIPRTLSMQGISQFLMFGQYFENDTYLSAVRVLPPAGWLEYDPETDQIRVERYWRLEETGNENRADTDELLERIDGAFTRAVRNQCHGDSVGMSLSGGVDSRTILAVVDQTDPPIQTITMGVEGCADHAVAAQLAELAGCSHHNHLLDLHFLDDFEKYLDGMIHLTDGMYLSECLVMSTLPLFRELGVNVLLRGHGGELMHMDTAYSYSLSRNVFGWKDESQLQHWLFDRLQAWMQGENRHPMLAPPWDQQFVPTARESLHRCLAESAQVEPLVDRVWHLFLSERLRRETSLSIAKMESVTEVRLPYLDNDLIELMMTAPAELRLDNKMQQHILRLRRPEFLDVHNVNTGTQIGASRLAVTWSTFRSKVLAKLRVGGYGHYEHMGRWLRFELRPLVESILLSDRCLSRGVFHPDSVPLILQEQFTKQRNHTFLILGMMILERALCEFVDSSP